MSRAWKNLFYSSLRSWGRLKISLQRGREETCLCGHRAMGDGLLRRLQKEGVAFLSLGCVVQTPVSRGLSVVEDVLDPSGCCQPCFNAHFSAYGRIQGPYGKFGLAGTTSGSVSGVIFFCFIFIVVGSAE